MSRHSKTLAGLGSELELFHGPVGACFRAAVQFGRGEGIEQLVAGRVHRHQLALEVGGELADLDTGLGAAALELVAVILACGSTGEVDET